MRKLSSISIAITVSFVLVLIALIPFFYQLFDTPKDLVFLGVYNNVLDYYHFLSEISLGLRGHLLVIDKMTNNFQTPSLYHEFNLLFGLIFSPFNISPIIVYHFFRVAIGFTYLITTFYFIKEFFQTKKERIIAFILAATQAGFLKIASVNGGLKFEEFLAFWSGGNPIRRILFLPNSMLRDLFFLLSTILLLKAFEEKSLKKAIVAGILSAFIAIQSPLHSIMLILIFSLYFVFTVIKTKKISINSVSIISILVFLSIPALYYINNITNLEPYLTAKLWEQKQNYEIPFLDFFLLLGPLIFLAIPGFFLGLKQKIDLKNFFLMALTILTIIPLIFPVTKPLGLTNFRFFGFPLNIILAIFAVKFLNNFRHSKFLIPVSLIILLLSIPTYVYSIKSQSKEFAYYSNVYPTKQWVNGLNYLKSNTSEQDVVLADLYSENIIPAFTKASVYLGHPVLTPSADEKAKITSAFFQGKMNLIEVSNFLKENKITYIFFDQTAGKNQYAFPYVFPKVFENEEVEIYKTIP